MEQDNGERQSSMVDVYFKRVTRIVEIYIFVCFILVTFIPLLDYQWVPGFTRFIYFTGFPLFLLLLLVSLVKEPFIEMLKRRSEGPPDRSGKQKG